MAKLDKDPKYFKEGAIIVGPRGGGKTTLAVDILTKLILRNNDLKKHYEKDIKENPDLFNQDLLKEYNARANFDFMIAGKKVVEQDPYKFMTRNDEYEFDYLPKGLFVLFDEAQTPYDSRKDKGIPQYVLRSHELARKQKWRIYLLAQRYIRIIKSIRELYSCFIYAVATEVVEKDVFGDALKVRVYYLEFSNDADIEAFVNTNTLNSEELLKDRSWRKKIKYIDAERYIFKTFDTDDFDDEFKPVKNKDVNKVIYLDWYKRVEKNDKKKQAEG